MNDMINVICSNDNLARKLIFQNTKITRNGDLFKSVVKDTQKACQKEANTLNLILNKPEQNSRVVYPYAKQLYGGLQLPSKFLIVLRL